MLRTVVLGGATYREYGYHWAQSMFATLDPPADVRTRLDALDVVLVPALARGYSGGRQTGTIFDVAIAAGADFVLTVECDMSWRPEHVARVLEAHDALATQFCCRVAVGATYPASSKAGQYVLAPLEGIRPEDVIALIPNAVDRLGDKFDEPDRFCEAAVLPCGFTLWPMAPFRGVEIVERMGARTFEGFDKAASEHLRSVGGRLFVDLSLDVGHMVAVPMTAAEIARKRVET